MVRALLVLAILAVSEAAFAQAWPKRPVRVVVPYPPGASTDIIARLLAPPLSAAIGQQVVIENRGGASGSIGATAVARAEPDGQTLLFNYATHATNPAFIADLPFDARKDFAPITMVGTSPLVLVASAKSQWTSIVQVLAEARKGKGAVSYGAIGPGGMGHLAMAQIANLGGFEWNYVPYKGAGPLMQDSIGGHMPLALGSIITTINHVKAGTLRPMAVMTLERIPVWPDVPTFNESGFKGFQANGWWGYLAPAKTPKPLVEQIHARVAAALKEPETAKKMAEQGLEGSPLGPDAFGAFLESEIVRWKKVVKDNGITGGG